MSTRHPYKRTERVADLMREVIAEILMKKTAHHGLEGVTVTGVSVSKDLQHARVYYSVLDAKKKPAVERSLRVMAPVVRRELGREVKIRYTPELKFEFDESLDYGNRIDSLLKSIGTGNGKEEE